MTLGDFERVANELIRVKEENQELKKQLKNKYEKVGALTGELLYEENTKLYNENRELKKQLEEYKKQVDKGLYNTCLPYTTGYNKAIEDKEIQQKEFIRWLDGNTRLAPEPKKGLLNEILQKYKSITGDDK